MMGWLRGGQAGGWPLFPSFDSHLERLAAVVYTHSTALRKCFCQVERGELWCYLEVVNILDEVLWEEVEGRLKGGKGKVVEV